MSSKKIDKADMISVFKNRMAIHEKNKDCYEIACDGYINALRDIIFNIDSGYSIDESIDLCMSRYQKAIKEFEEAVLDIADVDEDFSEESDEHIIEIRAALEECVFIKSVIDNGEINLLEQEETQKENFLSVNINGVQTSIDLPDYIIELFNGVENPAFHIMRAFQKLAPKNN